MRLTILLFALLSIYSCSKKNVSTIEEIDTPFVMPELMSTLNVHFKIDKEAINDTFNILIDNYLQTDMEIEALGSQVKLSKTEDATMEFLGREVLTTLPISIYLHKETIFKDIEANGSIQLTFISKIDVDTNWTVITETILKDYEWIEEPKLNLGGLKLSIASLANTIIDRSKESFEQQIDLSVSEQLDFRNRVLGMMQHVEQPILLDTVLNSWLVLRPNQIYMSDIENTAEYAIGNLTVHGTTKLSSEKPTDRISGIKLPAFSWEKKLDDTSHVNMVMDVSYDKINRYLKENYQGQRFENDGKHITINDIDLRKRQDKLEVISNVSGTINGDLIISGKPVFDNDNQRFYTDDIDINIKTRNVVKKAAAWLFKGKIKNQLKEMMQFSLNDNMMELQNIIDAQVENYKVEDQLDLNVDVRKIKIDKFVLDNDRIHAFVTVNVLLESIVYDLTAFDNPTLFRLKN